MSVLSFILFFYVVALWHRGALYTLLFLSLPLLPSPTLSLSAQMYHVNAMEKPPS